MHKDSIRPCISSMFGRMVPSAATAGLANRHPCVCLKSRAETSNPVRILHIQQCQSIRSCRNCAAEAMPVNQVLPQVRGGSIQARAPFTEKHTVGRRPRLHMIINESLILVFGMASCISVGPSVGTKSRSPDPVPDPCSELEYKARGKATARRSPMHFSSERFRHGAAGHVAFEYSASA